MLALSVITIMHGLLSTVQAWGGLTAGSIHSILHLAGGVFGGVSAG